MQTITRATALVTAIPPRFISERAAVLAMFARWERETLDRALPADRPISQSPNRLTARPSNRLTAQVPRRLARTISR
jgi:hypothetical protein